MVGGKGANLGELTQAGFNVPPGFCITTNAYDQFMIGNSQDIYAMLNDVPVDDFGAASAASAVGQAVRNQLGSLPLPEDVTTAILTAWRDIGTNRAYAVRSSATAEDLPSASCRTARYLLNVLGEEICLRK